MKSGNFILGLSAFYHDSAAALLCDDIIVAAAQEERFTRKKHDASFPAHAINYCLDFAGISLNELNAIAFYDKPFLKFERLLETYYAFAPHGLRSFVGAMPSWINEKLLLKKLILRELRSLEPFDRNKVKILFPEHHLSHAASAFCPSPFDEAAILTIDGVGEWATASICHGRGNRIEILRELKFPHSVGLLYSAFTYYLGFKVNSGEYKLMGLAPYGNRNSAQTAEYVDIIKKNLLQIYDDGSIWLDQNYFNYAAGSRMVNDAQWQKLFGFPRRNSQDALCQEHCDLALAIQKVTEEIILTMAKEAQRLTGSRYLCIAGGVALNCVANSKIVNSKLFENVWIQPAAGDAGGALGAAYSAYHIYFDWPRVADKVAFDKMQGSYLGPEFTSDDTKKLRRRYKCIYEYYENDDLLCGKVAELLDFGKVIGWFQGRMEWGPRSLGNRSILADARNSDMQKILNLKIKYRESFRPFAPAVLAEDSSEYFDLSAPSPYMLLTGDVSSRHQIPLPDDYLQRNWMDRLYHVRSDIPATTHVDCSARVQTVHQEINPLFHKLIHAFRKRTGYGVLVNTSFNVRGEPIVCTPADAYQCFMRTDMDYLVIGSFLFDKNIQPPWAETKDWRDDYVLD